MRNLLRRPKRQVPEAAIHRPSQNLTCFDFNLRATLDSGQLFRWKESNPGSFEGWIGPRLVAISQEGNILIFSGAPPDAIRRFFSLDVDLNAIAAQIDQDEVIHEALSRYWGLRVVRQEPWECLASFILSSFNNIPRLTGMLERLCLRFGEPAEAISRVRGFADTRPGPSEARRSLSRSLLNGKMSKETQRPCPARAARRSAHPRTLGWPPVGAKPPRWVIRQSTVGHPGLAYLEATGASADTQNGGGACYRFPKPERLAGVSERVLRNCGLGFRAPYIKEAAQAVASGRMDLEGLRDLEDEALRRALLGIPGVGEKVVECVMLFAYERAGAFPVDVWIGRAMRHWYFPKRKRVTDREIRAFALQHFGPFCGWAQQYLYCLAREGSWRVSLEATVPSGRIS